MGAEPQSRHPPNAQTQAQTALENHIRENLPDATVGDVIGGRRIIEKSTAELPAGLSTRTIVTGARYGRLPSQLQHHMTFAFGIDRLGELIEPVTFPWPRLNNHKVTLSFRPYSSADEQALASFLPQGPITDPSQLPSSIPSYLIWVVPEIAINGQVVGQGGLMRLGEDLPFVYGQQRVGYHMDTYTYQVPAGSYLSVAVAGGSVSAGKLQALKTKMEQTQNVLQSSDPALIGALTREDILGDMFQVGTLGYFGQYIALSIVASRPQQAKHQLPVAYGSIGYEPNVHTLFGFPRAMQPGGVAVNVRLAWIIQSLSGDQSKRRDLNLQTGLLSSALEHAVPEQMFSTPTQSAQGVSAVKALQLAAEQGQRIYHITPQNQAQALPNLRLDGLAINEIRDALAVGKEVIAHTDRIAVPGFVGEGYILFDPASGAGAYKITGGANGGWGYLVAAIVFGILAITILLMFGLPGILGWGWMLGLMGKMIGEYFDRNPDARYDSEINTAVRLVGFVIAIFVFGIAAFTIFTWASLIFFLLMGVLAIFQNLASVFERNRVTVRYNNVGFAEI